MNTGVDTHTAQAATAGDSRSAPRARELSPAARVGEGVALRAKGPHEKPVSPSERQGPSPSTLLSLLLRFLYHTGRELFLLLVRSLDGCDGQGWASQAGR